MYLVVHGYIYLSILEDVCESSMIVFDKCHSSINDSLILAFTSSEENYSR